VLEESFDELKKKKGNWSSASTSKVAPQLSEEQRKQSCRLRVQGIWKVDVAQEKRWKKRRQKAIR
jgi:hypothetical protein